MTIGGSILLIVAGAVLRYAINWTPNYVDLRLVGLILMIAGVAGLIIALTFLFMRRRGSRPSTEVYEERRYSEPPRRYDDPQRRYDDPQRRYDDPQRRYDDPQRRYDDPQRPYSEPPARYDEPTQRYGESDVYEERRYSDPPP
jgi:Domain of unknown function (DUF6458)